MKRPQAGSGPDSSHDGQAKCNPKVRFADNVIFHILGNVVPAPTRTPIGDAGGPRRIMASSKAVLPRNHDGSDHQTICGTGASYDVDSTAVSLSQFMFAGRALVSSSKCTRFQPDTSRNMVTPRGKYGRIFRRPSCPYYTEHRRLHLGRNRRRTSTDCSPAAFPYMAPRRGGNIALP
jgi:hypothetical protein